jgi:hypothetical protein
MHSLFVIARNSSFAYKGRAISVIEIAHQLGVVYIVTGSMRRSGSRVRVSVQLVEGDTGGAIWAERYDRDLCDILVLQEEVAEQIAGAIEPELLKKEGQRAADRPFQNLTAWDMLRRGIWEFHKFTPASLDGGPQGDNPRCSGGDARSCDRGAVPGSRRKDSPSTTPRSVASSPIDLPFISRAGRAYGPF